MNKTIRLPIYGIELTLVCDEYGKPTCNGQITSDLKDDCPYCGHPDCYFDCDESQAGGFNGQELETDEETEYRRTFNTSVDAIEALILAHACSGIDIENSAYIEGIKTVIEKLAND